MVALASLFPVRGEAAKDFGGFTKLVIALLFFLHGAKLSRDVVMRALLHWRLHLVIIATTFAVFPGVGLLVARATANSILPPALATGVLFLTCLPSTVQSSIAFTSIARGNVAAAVCAASASNFLGIFLTPLLAAFVLGAHGSSASLGLAEAVALQLLAPFIAGQIAGVWIAGWMKRHTRLISLVDR